MTDKKHPKIAKEQQKTAQEQAQWVEQHRLEIDALAKAVKKRHRLNHYTETLARAMGERR